MRFTDGFLDEIRARLPVSHVVSKRVKLRRQGREFIGLSPFKPEKTRSFTVNDQKSFYHCFASGEHGDIFDFVMKTEGLGFPEAVERLAGEAGLALPVASPDAAKREAKRKSLHEVMEKAARFFEDQLAGQAGREACGTLAERGVAEDIQARFRIGYAPRDRHALKQFLAADGISQEEMIAAGLLISGDDIPVSYDRFRHRIIFPIRDLKGRVIAFGGRALDPDQPAKYLNSPETTLFHKGSVLFNAAPARQAAHDTGQLIVVEGYMDVIALAGAGLDQAVAPLGTALTSDQLQLLWRFCPEPVLCFDGDSAGIKAAYRAVDTVLPLLRPGLSLSFAFLPEGQDPDDMVRHEGPGAFRRLLSAARPLVDVLWGREWGAGNWATPEQRAAFEARIEALVDQIGEQKVRDHYRTEVRARLGNAWERQTSSGKRRYGSRSTGGDGRGAAKRGWSPRRPAFDVQMGTASDSLARSALVQGGGAGYGSREVVLLMTLVNHPWLLDAHMEDIAAISFSSQRLKQLCDALLGLAIDNETLDSEAMRTQLSKQGFGAIVAGVERAITHKSDWFTEPGAPRDDVETGWRQVLALHRKSLELERELEAAEQAYLAEGTEQAFERLCDIRRQISDADGIEASREGYGEEAEIRLNPKASVG